MLSDTIFLTGGFAADASIGSGIEEEGARTILYLMAESGDIAEVRKDVFSIA